MTLEVRQKREAVSRVGPVFEGCSVHPPSLVPIQPGGSKPPFFCVPGRPDDGAAVLGLMARHLGPDQPLYGIQDGVRDPVMSISCGTSAARYVDQIRAVQPRGPYLLGGVSSGGLMAFEMANQLQIQGQQVALLALVEPEPLWVPDLRVCVTLAASFFRFVVQRLGRCPYDVGRLCSVGRAYPPGQAPSLRSNTCPPGRAPSRRSNTCPPGRAPSRRSNTRPPGRAPCPRLKTEIAAKSWGLRRYARRPYQGPVHLFLVSDLPAESPSAPAPYARWCEWVGSGTEVHVIPGIRDVTTDDGGEPIKGAASPPLILKGADTHALAQQLRGCIDEALARGYRF